jgi:hypothetical protein
MQADMDSSAPYQVKYGTGNTDQAPDATLSFPTLAIKLP